MTKLPWTKWSWQDWLADIDLQRASTLSKGVWVQILAYMDRGNTYKITATKAELARVVKCTGRDITHFLSESRRTRFCVVTERHGKVTVVSRRLKRKYKDKESNRLRQERFRKKHSTGESNGEDNDMSQFPDIEVEVEVDIDKRAEESQKENSSAGSKIEPAALGAAVDDEFDTEELQDLLAEWAAEVEHITGFNAFKFINSKNSALKGSEPWPAKCFSDTFRRYLRGWRTLDGNIKNPWAYMESIWEVEAPNVLADMRVEAIEKEKPEAVDELSALIDLIGR